MFRIFRYGGTAAAAALLVGLLGLLWLSDRSAGRAFADVIENVRNAQSVTFVLHQQMGGPPAMTMKWYVQGDAARMEMPGQYVVVDVKRKRTLQITPETKRVRLTKLDDSDESKQMARLLKNPMDYFQELTEDDAEKTGEDELEGRKVDVYRLKRFFGVEMPEQDDENHITAWVDRRSGLPVRIAVRGSFLANGKSKDWFLLEKFTWNQPLDPGLFSMEIPAGYAVAPRVDQREPGKDPQAALADVIGRVKQAKSVTGTIRSGRGPERVLHAELYAQGEATRREVVDLGVHAEDRAEGKAVHLLPASKRAHQWEMDDERPSELTKRLPSPVVAIGAIRSEDAEWLGEVSVKGGPRWHYRVEKVDLQAALGGPAEARKAEVVVMVDPQTRLPVEVIATWPIAGETKIKAWLVFEKLQWNQPLDPSLFRLDVPEGYAVVEGEPTAEALAAEKEAAPKPPEPEVDFARVIENVSQAESLTCTVDSTAERSHGMAAFLRVQGPAARREIPTFFVQIEDLSRGTVLQLSPGAERAYRWNVDDGEIPYARRRFPNPLLLFRNMKPENAERVRVEDEEGRPEVLFRLKEVDIEAMLGKTDEALNANLYIWVDPETQLPTKISLGCRHVADNRTKASFRWQKLEWGKPIDSDLFQLRVPEGYQVIEGPPPEGQLGPDLNELLGAGRAAVR